MKEKLKWLSHPMPMLFFSAVFSALSMSIPSLFLLSWFSFTPFFICIVKNGGQGNLWRAIGRGVFFGFVYHASVYFWFLWMYPLDFAGLSSAASIAFVLLAWLGISLIHGLFYAIPTVFCHLAAKKISSKPFLLFLGVVGILLAQKIPQVSELAFPWVRVSLGQYRAPVLIQLASVFGMDGVDFIMLSVSAFLALKILFQGKKRLYAVLFAGIVFFANLIFGFVRMKTYSPGESIRVAAIQGCILSGEKWDSSFSSYDMYVSLTEENIRENVDLVVWPESAVPVNLYLNPGYLSAYQDLAERVKAEILMGCFWKIDGVTSNSAVLIGENFVSDVYSKRHLVPFGEVMPYRAFFSRVFPFLENINMLSSDLAQGSSTEIFSGEKGNYGALICFESVFPKLVRETTQDGAEMLVVVTNDSWYKDSPGVWQHLAHSVFRSVENGRTVVRCANSGVSAFIDPRGRITSELGPLERGVLEDEASFSSEETLYVLWGDIFFPFLLTVAFLWGGFLLFWERRKTNE